MDGTGTGGAVVRVGPTVIDPDPDDTTTSAHEVKQKGKTTTLPDQTGHRLELGSG